MTKTFEEQISLKEKKKKGQLPESLPIIPLRNTVLFPQQIMPLSIGRDKTLKLISEFSDANRLIGVVAQKESSIENPSHSDMYEYGVAATIMRVFDMPDGSKSVIVQGVQRIRLKEFIQDDPYWVAKIDELVDIPPSHDDLEIDALVMNIKSIFQKMAGLAPYLTAEQTSMILNVQLPGRVADVAVSALNISTEEKQEILQVLNVKERLDKTHVMLNKVLQTLELGNKIQSDVQDEISKTQREYYLREQLKAIQRELGDAESANPEITEIKEKIEKAKMPKEVYDVTKKELERLGRMSPMAAEYTVSRTYIDWLVDMPWSIFTEDNMKIDAARKSLESDHYGLEKVKKRILEYLSVRKLKNDMRGPILCFVGPPGVGKTSLGRSIAKALGRKFVRMSLGGIRDEAEIRGHRRTYIGALPGRVIQGIKKGGSINPVFMLDEIDKVGMDFRGDPSSALLEVLDPEQNFSFADHYLDVPFDLSKVLFIATANLADPIIPALRDRMEIIEIPGYTEEEKINIAQKFIIPKQISEHGLSGKQIKFDRQTIKHIIRDHTREAGLRNLEREIATICRGVAHQIAEGKITKTTIDKKNLYTYLGKIKFFSDAVERINKPGIVTGLAWTAAGGDILFIEASKMKGKGNLTLTGQLGDIMKESAVAALSQIRSQAEELGITDEFDKIDIHIHVPAGGIPKDGPSAGITMYTAIYSLLTNRLVRNDIAMTGEITLRGAVLPIGGVKEKILAAHRAGIRTIIIPNKNANDLDEVPKQIRDEIKFVLVKEVSKVVEIALEPIVKSIRVHNNGVKPKRKKTKSLKRSQKK
ncbi:endopeptidase La [bacterium]|nr:MAG: endopeptidase La [bacterium]